VKIAPEKTLTDGEWFFWAMHRRVSSGPAIDARGSGMPVRATNIHRFGNMVITSIGYIGTAQGALPSMKE
jgi:hypothetical protein